MYSKLHLLLLTVVAKTLNPKTILFQRSLISTWNETTLGLRQDEFALGGSRMNQRFFLLNLRDSITLIELEIVFSLLGEDALALFGD